MSPNVLQQCPPGTFPYIIRPGDNFYRIAIRFNTTIPALISANPLANPYNLLIGQTICVPRQRIYPACPEGNYYTIRRGDTLYSIARAYNVSLDDLLEANPGIDPRRLFVGQVICIPLATPPVRCPEGEIYTVQAGDTFYRIARRFNISLDALIEANPGINPDRLLIGQRICIPEAPVALPPTKTIPVFVEGETEYREARLQRSDQGYYIYVLDNFQFASEEPGRDLLFSNFDEEFFVRIEKLPPNASIQQLKENARTELRLVGTPVELTGEGIFDPFFRQSKFFLHASNPTLSKNIIVKEIEDVLFKFTVNLPNVEAAEGLSPSLYAMLKTIEV